MDILFYIGLVLLIGLTIIHAIQWVREKYKITSPSLRSGLITLVCFTILAVLLFGMRLFLKPEVSIKYVDTSQDLSSNMTISPTDPTLYVFETRKRLTCDVTLDKSYPLSLFLGKDTKHVKYKVPCDALTAEMKSDISNITSYLKDEVK